MKQESDERWPPWIACHRPEDIHGSDEVAFRTDTGHSYGGEFDAGEVKVVLVPSVFGWQVFVDVGGDYSQRWFPGLGFPRHGAVSCRASPVPYRRRPLS